MKPIKVLVMSVGAYAKNHTAKYIERIGGKERMVVCLPLQFKENAHTYTERGIEVFLYDEKKYINSSFEFFGFKPRNCGGVGRQGIAEATEKYGNDFLCFQLDDDYTAITARIVVDGRVKGKTISSWENFENYVRALDDFYNATGVDLGAQTGATNVGGNNVFVNAKIFNNFVMRKGNKLNFDGFAALCSDDQRFNIYRNLLQQTPMLSTLLFSVLFAQNQGDRKDGNAVLYNSDCSWKKSFGLKMMFPWAVATYIKHEANRVLFREHIETSKLYPCIVLEDKIGGGAVLCEDSSRCN